MTHNQQQNLKWEWEEEFYNEETDSWESVTKEADLRLELSWHSGDFYEPPSFDVEVTVEEGDKLTDEEYQSMLEYVADNFQMDSY